MSTAHPIAALSANGISLNYGSGVTPVLANFHLDLAPGEIVTVLGPSGVGKSSLLRVLAGLQRPNAGSVATAGTIVAGVHPRLAMAFQNPCLLPWLNLEQNVDFGLDFKHQPKLHREERRRRVDEAIIEVGLDHARHLRPSALSGGMAQRAALARCLARKPEVLLLDEPFGALDEVTREEMQRLLVKIVDDYGTSAVLVTHDIDEALMVSDRIVLLGGAPASQVGEWRIAIARPRDDYVGELGQLRIEILSTLRNAVRRH